MSQSITNAKKPKPIPLPPFRPLTRRLFPNGPLVVAYANEGGGTRKTTGAVNTAVALSRKGLKVGLICADQTMAASTYLTYGVTERDDYPIRTETVYAQLAMMPNLFGILTGDYGIKDALLPARTRIVKVEKIDDEFVDDGRWDTPDCFETIPNLQLVLGSRQMAAASELIRGAGLPGSKVKAGLHWLRLAIAELPEGLLDILIIDTRGTFDTLELSELGGADYVVGCVKADTRDSDTLHGLKGLIDDAQKQFQFSGGAASLRYILFNGHITNRGGYYIKMFEKAQARYGELLLPHVNESVQVAESVEAQEPVHFWCDPTAEVVRQFDAIADVIARDAKAQVA